MTIQEKLEACKKTRKIASQALFIALKDLLSRPDPISEINLRDRWLKELRKHKSIYPDGWYLPPPHGIAVLFATEKDLNRIKFKTLRHKESWPRKDIFLNREKGLALLYCSPVSKKTGIIGDFGLNLYFGRNKNISNILKKHLYLVKMIFNHVKIGLRLSDIHQFAKKILEKNGFSSEWWISTTDPTGTNFGHTIPATDVSWTDEELKILQNGEKHWKKTLKMINHKRKFTNACEKTIITPGMALTLEPRVVLKNHPEIPVVYYHTIALIKKNGKKELLTDFNELFKLAEMNYMLK